MGPFIIVGQAQLPMSHVSRDEKTVDGQQGVLPCSNETQSERHSFGR